MEKHFLEHYEIHKKPEALTAARRKSKSEDRPGILKDRSAVIQAYLERLERIFLHPKTAGAVP